NHPSIFLLIPPPPRSTLFPYTTLFRSCGRNGLHRYNNQDHSMWTAILATLNLLDGTGYDVWSVNTEAEYLEEGDAVEALLDVERSEEHTSELQSRGHLVCRLLLEKKKK